MIVLTRTTRIDWARLVENLRRCGMSTVQIAEHLEVSESTVKNYRSAEGSEPAFWVGSALLLLWAERTGCKWVDAPTRRVTPSVSEVLRASA